jgi:hypothetical protein
LIGVVTDKEETIQIVQKGFPELAEFEEKRITFLNGDGAIIFEEAWEHFGSSPPEKLKIVVTDAPGEKKKRELVQHRRGIMLINSGERRDNIICGSVTGVIILLFGSLLAAAIYDIRTGGISGQ